MDEFGQEDTMPSSLEGQLFEPGVPEGAHCIKTAQQFLGRCGGVLDGKSQEEEEY